MVLSDGAPAAAAPAGFADSRAWAGANRLYGVPAVVLRALGEVVARDGAVQGRWIALVVDMARVLGWPDPLPRVHVGSGPAHTWLAFAAPADQLPTAAALNEWAWLAAAEMRPMQRSCHALGPDPVAHFTALAAAASASPPAAPPPPKPTLLVTGRHGKTTVLRLLAAVAHEAGCHPGLAGHLGPADAATVLHDAAVDTALLELPPAQLLEQGLPVVQAQVAVLTDVGVVQPPSDEAAATLLVVAHAVAASGALVMSGDDADLLRVALGQAHSTAPSWALFSRDHATPLLDALRRHGGSTCAPRAGRLVLVTGGVEHDLGALAEMPLSLGGHAAQQVANLGAAALAAALAGWPLDALRRVLLRFGAAPEDNPGRLERRAHHGATVLLDRAGDPDSLAQLLKLAGALGARRVGLLLGASLVVSGDAGAQTPEDSASALAQAAAAYKPDRVVITEPPLAPGQAGHAERGLLPLLLEQGLRAGGLSARALRHEHDAEAAARALLAWARAGDVVLLPLHSAALHQRLLDATRAPDLNL